VASYVLMLQDTPSLPMAHYLTYCSCTGHDAWHCRFIIPIGHGLLVEGMPLSRRRRRPIPVRFTVPTLVCRTFFLSVGSSEDPLDELPWSMIQNCPNLVEMIRGWTQNLRRNEFLPSAEYQWSIGEASRLLRIWCTITFRQTPTAPDH
jgi:hypothetical protein